jgi:hypothetical protein
LERVGWVEGLISDRRSPTLCPETQHPNATIAGAPTPYSIRSSAIIPTTVDYIAFCWVSLVLNYDETFQPSTFQLSTKKIEIHP